MKTENNLQSYLLFECFVILEMLSHDIIHNFVFVNVHAYL